MKVGIVGHEAAKFTPENEVAAKKIIRELLSDLGDTLVSGACHLGGIDVWAEEIADYLGNTTLIFPPKEHNWTNGYKPRNIEIAKNSDIVHCLVVRSLPPTYRGMRFATCYHCKSTDHVKSGGCWTMKYAQGLGKKGVLHVIGG